MSVIAPLTRRCSSRNASSAWAITSTSALPMPTTSYRARAGTADHAIRRTDTIRPVSATETPTLDPYRLPRTAIPSRYELELVPSLESATFDGRVEIQVDVIEPASELVLNAAELQIRECDVDG